MAVTTLVVGPVDPAAAALPPVQVVTGSGHTCALAPSGQTYCWGLNSSGELGDNTTTIRSTPVAVQQGAVKFTSLTAGNAHTCGLTSAGAAYCWGNNGSGRLGDNTTTERHTPTAVSGGLTWSSLSAGASHTCGLTTAGAAYCWGWNNSGRLGDGTTTNRNTPTAVSGGLTWSSISAGTTHTCGLTTAGVAYCWGYNANGRLGDVTTTQRLTPTAVSGGLTWSSTSNGDSHTCGLTTAGVAYCWGYNANGRLGDGTTTQRLTPTAVSGGLTWSTIVSSDTSLHTCAVEASSQLIYCWGPNANFQLGDSTTIDRYTPIRTWFLVTSAENTVSAVVDPVLSFSVSAHSGACNGVVQSAGVTASATAVDLGRMSSSSNLVGAQDLTVATNAASGFTVYARSSGPMADGAGHAISDLAGGKTNAAPGAFDVAGIEAFGYTTSDSTLSGTADRFTNPRLSGRL